MNEPDDLSDDLSQWEFDAKTWGGDAGDNAFPSREALQAERDREAELLFNSTVRFANEQVAGMKYGDKLFSAVNNLRKVATDAHGERMALRKAVRNLLDANTPGEANCQAMAASMHTAVKQAREADRVLSRIRSRVPSFVWRWLTRNPKVG